jgi:integrase
MVEFLAYSGMRVGEAREILVRDINFPRGTVLITGGEIRTKNLHQRTIPLFPSLRSLLERLNSDGRIGSPDEKLFRILSPRNAMEPACKRIGLRRFTVHALRHFFASNAIEMGINHKTIAEWLGHSDGGVLVAKTYGHLRSEFSAQMAALMTFEATPTL